MLAVGRWGEDRGEDSMRGKEVSAAWASSSQLAVNNTLSTMTEEDLHTLKLPVGIQTFRNYFRNAVLRKTSVNGRLHVTT